MNIEDFERYLRQGNMAENTIAAYLYAVKEYYTRHKELNKRNLLVYKTYLIETFKPRTVNLRIQALKNMYRLDITISIPKEAKYVVSISLSYYARKLPNSFRHRFAKIFLDKFNDISLLADLMGHESIETTRIYLRRSSAEQQEIVDKIITW
jgi:site-specific recombinase XerD